MLAKNGETLGKKCSRESCALRRIKDVTRDTRWTEKTQKKDIIMKNNRIAKLFGFAGLVVTITATFALAGDVQYKTTSDDGIAASPKVRQELTAKAASGAVTTTKVAAMACAKCKDVSVAAANGSAKGAEVMAGVTPVVIKHTCGGCDTTLDVVGTGKAKQTVATHKCTERAVKQAGCCSKAPMGN